MSSKDENGTERRYGAQYKLIGKNYVTADLHAKVTGKAKYAEDFRAEGMLFCKLLLSPLPHGRVTWIDAREALAMPGVRAILRPEKLPAPADSLTDNGTVIKATKWAEQALTMEPQGVELIGQAGAASQLIQPLESSPWLERVEFTSPVTRAQGKEQFRMRASWERR